MYNISFSTMRRYNFYLVYFKLRQSKNNQYMEDQKGMDLIITMSLDSNLVGGTGYEGSHLFHVLAGWWITSSYIFFKASKDNILSSVPRLLTSQFSKVLCSIHASWPNFKKNGGSLECLLGKKHMPHRLMVLLDSIPNYLLHV